MKFKDRLKRTLSKSIILDSNRNVEKGSSDCKGQSEPPMTCDENHETSFGRNGIFRNSASKGQNFSNRNRKRNFKNSVKYSRHGVLGKSNHTMPIVLHASRATDKKTSSQSGCSWMLNDYGDFPRSGQVTDKSNSNLLNVQMPSCITNTKELVDFSTLVKSVGYPKTKYPRTSRNVRRHRENDCHVPVSDSGNDVDIPVEKCDNNTCGSIQNRMIKNQLCTSTTLCQVNKDQDSENRTGPARAMTKVLVKELSPTCSDIYGNDEDEGNLSFGQCPTVEFAQDNGEQGYIVINENNHSFDDSVKTGNHKKSMMKSIHSEQISKTSSSENESNSCNNNKVDKYLMPRKCSPLNGPIESIQVTKHNVSFESPWVLHSEAGEDEVSVDETDKYCSVELVEKSLPPVFPRLDKPNLDRSGSFGFDVSHQSLGFEVNHGWDVMKKPIQCDTNEPNLSEDESINREHKKPSRSDSRDSLNSFGSSVHTVESNELPFFSDSEAEHNHSASDLEEPQKQIIPYALSEGLGNSGRSPKRKLKKLKSKSIEEKINEIAKHVTQLIDTKGEDNSAEKKKIYGAMQSKSVEEVREIDSRKVKTLNRRSLDSNFVKQEAEGSSKRKSVLANSTELLLSPVLEAEGKVSRRINSRKSTNVEKEDQKFYTLPNPRKRSAHSPKRKISRLGSLSKIFSDKAQSLSTLKLSSSFKLRSESEASDTTWSQLSLSANSLAYKMVKKASKYSTLIRRRANSNTMVDSPFNNNRTARKSKPKEEDLIELVYEKVFVNVARKRPATNQEKKSVEKRLKLNIDLAKSYKNVDMESKSVTRRNNRSVGQMNSDESPSGLQSPTLLDEIMKSVDAVRVRELCSAGEYDDMDDDSSDCESSSSSSMLVFPKKDTKGDSLLMGFCRGCGRIRNPSDESVDSTSNQVVYQNRMAISLCDLTAKCVCAKHGRKQWQSRASRVFEICNDSKKSERKDLGSVIGAFKDCLATPFKDVKSCSMSELTYGNSISKSSLQERTKQPGGKVDVALKDSSEFLQAVPGFLLRHQPVMDLSSDNLDNTLDSEFELHNDEATDRKCLSCGDLLGYSKPSHKSASENEAKKNGKSENFQSSNELSEHGDEGITRSSRNSQKFHSCGNLLDSNDIVISDQLQQKELSKRELRKLKVKSMSSSHDVLNTPVPTVTIDIDNAGDNNDDDRDNVIVECKVDNEINASKNSNKIETEMVIRKDNVLNERKEKYANMVNQANKNKLTVPDIVTAKPPLPFKKTHKKGMSLGDIDLSDDKENIKLESHLTKRHSMVDCIPHINLNSADVTLCSNCDKKLKDNGSICLNTTMSGKMPISVPKFAFDDKHVQEYIQAQQHRMLLPRQRSISSNELSQSKTPDTEKLYSAHSMNRLLQDSWSDDVFHNSSIPPHMPFSAEHSLGITSPSFGNKSQFPPFGTGKSLPELSPYGVESVCKYDVGLGYLLHSLQCDNMVISVYSFQRNKQFMESVITPLSALPGSPQTKPSHPNSTNKHKASPGKLRPEDQPNPAAPITQVPSERLVHAGHVLRTVLFARAPHMIRDRKFHLRTYRRCMVGTEMVDWLLQHSSLVHSRTQAVGMWQALVEEGVVVHVCHEHQFKDKYLFYRFHDDDEGVSTVPSSSTKRECEEDLGDVFMMLTQIGPDAMMRMILRKPSHERTSEDLEIIYEELLHIKALSHLSTMVKRELASVLVFESHAKAGTVLFNQGDEGKSWYIILKGSVNVIIYGKGVVCTLHEGDDFGKLALVNDAPRAATIVLRDDNSHFLRVDKDDFNRILRDVEANTVRLKEHGQDVLVLEKIPTNTQSPDGTVQQHYKYSVMAGTPEKMLEHLLEGHLDNRNETEIDGFLEDFLLTHVIFMPYNHLCPVLLSHYHSSTADSEEQEGAEFMLNHKKCVLHFVQEWANIVGVPFKQDHTINAFLEELLSCVTEDLEDFPSLKNDLDTLEAILTTQNGSSQSKLKKRSSGSFLLSRKTSKECFQDLPKKRKPIKRTDDIIIKVYCADHSYTTLKLPMDARVESLLASTVEKLDLGEDIILCEVKSTGERLVFKDNDLCVTTSLSINGRLFVTPKEHIDALTPLPEQEGPNDGSFTTIETFSSREMAYQMTLYDWELFTCVQEYELIYQVFGRHKFGKITANLDVFLRRFNEIQFWVVTEMVMATNLSKRVSLLRKFIKIAAHCKEYQNLNSFFAIVMGLSNIAVSRLSQTWEKLPGKLKKMFADFETLMDPSRNHRVYRLSVAKMQPTIIPFMPLLMKDMTFTHEGNKTYFESLVNFEKMHMIAQTLKTVRFCRSAPLDLEAPNTMKGAETSEYIRDLHVIDNQRILTQLSHKLEPRKT